jgi:2-polyprenyl-3-methyl-5-hydroxy-6-metoxy-1,4-benzoquinol methylase
MKSLPYGDKRIILEIKGGDAMDRTKSQNRSLEDKKFFYDRFAEDFDQRMNYYDLNTRLDLVFGQLLPPDIAGKRLLDLGCGTGHFSQKACSKGAIVTSIDIGTKLLSHVAEKCVSDRSVGSALHLSFKPNTFDFIICTEVIEHTEDPFGVLKELYSTLRPGGTLALTVPNRFWKWSCVLANLLKLRPYEGLENWVGYFSFYKALKKNGFQVQKYFGFHLFPFQINFFHPFLKKADKFGKYFGFLFINIGVRCQKDL